LDAHLNDSFTGDPSWKVTRNLADGTVITIRPITPEDRDELRREFKRTSPQTRYLRFLGVVGELSEETLTYLTCVDQQKHVALVATVTSPDLKTERGVGVARLIRLANDPNVAEAAITVADDLQKHGIGTALAIELERAARARGIRHIRADVLEGNATMRGILEGAGAQRVDAGETTGTISYDIALDAAAPSTSSRLLDVLRGAAQTMAVTIRKLAPPDSKREPKND
jgi:RimJ/RimL family protein N-acetyltransferase